MTADEYECILCPTDADFRSWTADLFRRAAQICRRVDRLYPNLGKRESKNENLPLFEAVV